MHIMIDCETLGVGPTAALLQIAAVAFEPVNGGKVLNKQVFNQYVKPHQEATVDAGTLGFWLSQSEAARKNLVGGLKRARAEQGVLLDFINWPAQMDLSWNNIGGVWSHGSTADLTWLMSAFVRNNYLVPWHYRAPRDTRTLFEIVGGQPKVNDNTLVHHDASHDILAQVTMVQEAMGRLGR